MSDARTATWAAPLPKNLCSVLGARALFQLPPTSKNPRMRFPLWPHCFNHWNHSPRTRAALSLSPNHTHALLPKAPTAHNE